MTEVAIVTGSAGALGSAISERLTADGFKVTGADIRTGAELVTPRFALSAIPSTG